MLKNHPSDSFLLHAKALELIKMNELEQAKSTFINLLTDNPDYLGSYYHLAQLLASMGDKELAEHYFEKGMQIARRQNDIHTYNELKAAYDDLMI